MLISELVKTKQWEIKTPVLLCTSFFHPCLGHLPSPCTKTSFCLHPQSPVQLLLASSCAHTGEMQQYKTVELVLNQKKCYFHCLLPSYDKYLKYCKCMASLSSAVRPSHSNVWSLGAHRTAQGPAPPFEAFFLTTHQCWYTNCSRAWFKT